VSCNTGAEHLRARKMRLILEILELAKRIVEQTGKPFPIKGVENLW